jgi:hypothetical protein
MASLTLPTPCAQDVERERAQAGDDAGLAPDPAGVLAERAVTP